MANGYCPALLKAIDEIAGENSPTRKMRVAGFLAMTFCCQNSTVSPLNDAYADGGIRNLTVSYQKRPLVSDVQDEDDCDINRIPAKLEWTFPNTSHKQHSFYLSDDQVQRYCAASRDMVNFGSAQIQREHYDQFLMSANAVLGAINKDLVTQMSTQWGLNVGDPAAPTLRKTININPTPSLSLSTGVIQLLRDLQENEVCGDPCIVGGGNWAGYQKAVEIACCNSAGQDIGRLGIPRTWFDKDFGVVHGSNDIGVFAPGSVKFIGRVKYPKYFEGGTSIFFSIPFPVQDFGCAQDCLGDLVFDVQMRYIDCPTTVTINGSSTTVTRGWQVIVSKDYNLWVQPATAFASGDPLFQTNGTLRYTVTNS